MASQQPFFPCQLFFACRPNFRNPFPAWLPPHRNHALPMPAAILETTGFYSGMVFLCHYQELPVLLPGCLLLLHTCPIFPPSLLVMENSQSSMKNTLRHLLPCAALLSSLGLQLSADTLTWQSLGWLSPSPDDKRGRNPAFWTSVSPAPSKIPSPE